MIKSPHDVTESAICKLPALVERIAVALEKATVPTFMVARHAEPPPVCTGSGHPPVSMEVREDATISIVFHCGICGQALVPNILGGLAPTHAYRPKEGT